jgi:hypothetical protein
VGPDAQRSRALPRLGQEELRPDDPSSDACDMALDPVLNEGGDHAPCIPHVTGALPRLVRVVELQVEIRSQGRAIETNLSRQFHTQLDLDPALCSMHQEPKAVAPQLPGCTARLKGSSVCLENCSDSAKNLQLLARKQGDIPKLEELSFWLRHGHLVSESK